MIFVWFEGKKLQKSVFLPSCVRKFWEKMAEGGFLPLQKGRIFVQ
jgi:hypothetical protein